MTALFWEKARKEFQALVFLLNRDKSELCMVGCIQVLKGVNLHFISCETEIVLKCRHRKRKGLHPDDS